MSKVKSRIAVLLTILLIFSTVNVSVVASAASVVKGMDISYFQGNIDFSKVKSSGINFAIIREGYRQTVDTKFATYVKGCKDNGIEIKGVYHFSYALNVEQAKQEAKFCIQQMKNAGLGKDVIIFFDFEYDTVTKAKNQGVNLGYNECNAHTKAFCEYVTSQGYKAGIYANGDYYKNMYDKSLLSKYIFWLADYSGDPDYPCIFHQYTSSGKVNGISGNVDLNYYYGSSTSSSSSSNTQSNAKVRSRAAVVDLLKSWLGKNEYDGSYKSIVDIYNSYKGSFPRGTKMAYGWAWCACTWSAVAIKLGYTDIMPIEISCYYIIEQAKKMGCWQENDAYVPKPGDAILYDWEDSGVGDNVGNPDHIGTVEVVNKSNNTMTIIEGNYADSVKRRTISINGKSIRGFICPKYTTDGAAGTSSTPAPTKSIDEVAKEVISGAWGDGNDRIQRLTAAGYDPNAVQKKVNELLGSSSKPSTPAPAPAPAPAKKTVEEIAKEVLAGQWGNGDTRISKLKAAGYDPDAVQKKVNELLAASQPAAPAKTVDQIAQEVLDGKWGDGDTRISKLKAAGYDPNAVQKKVNELIAAQTPKKTVKQIAQEVIDGKWGSGDARIKKLKAAGYDPDKVQKKVNELLGVTTKKSVAVIAQEVIDGKWGNGTTRTNKLKAAGYDPDKVQKKVNELLKAQTKAKTYKVVSGDTLSKIAKKYGTTASAIVKANKSKYSKITANYIEIGWVLTIPA